MTDRSFSLGASSTLPVWSGRFVQVALVFALVEGCTGDAPGPDEVLPEATPESESVTGRAALRARRFGLWEWLPDFTVQSGFAGKSPRFLRLHQDPDRNEDRDRLRLLVAPSCVIRTPRLEIPADATLDLAVGVDWLDMLVPDEGDPRPLESLPDLEQVVAVRFAPAGFRSRKTTLTLGERTLVLRSGSHRVVEPWRVSLAPCAGQSGWLEFVTRRPDDDLRRVPTWWSPVIEAVTASKTLRPDPSPDCVVADLLDPRRSMRWSTDQMAWSDVAPVDLVSIGRRWIEGDIEEGEEATREDEVPVEVPGFDIEAHFDPGPDKSVAGGGPRPALVFARDGAVAFEVQGWPVGAELVLELGHRAVEGQGVGGRSVVRVHLGDGLVGEVIHETGQGADVTSSIQRGLKGFGNGEVAPLAPPRPDPSAAGTSWTSYRVPMPDHWSDGDSLWLEVASEGSTWLTKLVGERTSVWSLDRPVLGIANPRLVVPTNRPRASKRASVLVISSETLRADVLADPDIAPCLHALAAEGRVFERAYAPASWTLPSVSSLLTGHPPSTHGAVDERHDRLAPWWTTLPEAAAEQGVRTAAFVSNDLLRAEAGFAQGFETFVCAHTANAAQLGAAWRDWLTRVDGESFFAFVHPFDPHAPFNAPGAWRNRSVPEEMRHGTPLQAEAVVRQTMRATLGTEGTDDALAYLRGRYAGEVAYLDAQIQRMFDALEDAGRLEETYVVLLADHGEEFGEHDWYGHGSQLYDETLRVPLVLWGPDVEAGRVSKPVPTLAASWWVADRLGLEDWARARADGELGLDGVPTGFESFVLETEKGVDLTGGAASILEAPHRIDPRPMRAWIRGSTKLIVWFARRPATLDGLQAAFRGDDVASGLIERIECFDLETDADEQQPTVWSAADAPEWVRDVMTTQLLRELAAPPRLGSAGLTPSLRELLARLGYLEAGAGETPSAPDDSDE